MLRTVSVGEVLAVLLLNGGVEGHPLDLVVRIGGGLPSLSVVHKHVLLGTADIQDSTTRCDGFTVELEGDVALLALWVFHNPSFSQRNHICQI